MGIERDIMILIEYYHQREKFDNVYSHFNGSFRRRIIQSPYNKLLYPEFIILGMGWPISSNHVRVAFAIRDELMESMDESGIKRYY